MNSAEIVVDAAAIRANVRALREIVGPDVAMMTVVKADGYGHGMELAARAAREGGADWLGVATPAEALRLRSSGDDGRVLCWLAGPEERYDDVVRADVDVTAYSVAEVDAIAEAAQRVGRRARLQLKIDTGLSRGGATAGDWPELVAAARRSEDAGHLVVTGVWSHLATADEAGHPATDRAEAAFADALQAAQDAGLRPEVRHLANSAGALLRPSAHYDLVRCGIASYGLDPAPGQTPPDLLARLRPAMTVRAPLVLSKPLDAGAGVSYGHQWIAETPTTVGLVPAGYADGVPRHAGNTAEVWAAGSRRPIRGRICMDQFVVDLGGDALPPGTEVVLFGDGSDGAPTAQDWAEACGTISYEIVTRIGGRFARRPVDSDLDQQETR